MTHALGPACLEYMRVCIEEVSRICLVGWRRDCGPVRFRLGGARGGGVGVAGGGGGGGGAIKARVSSPSSLRTVCSSLRRAPFSAVREFIVSLISVTVAVKANTSALISPMVIMRL
jgi:hypothetical protein